MCQAISLYLSVMGKTHEAGDLGAQPSCSPHPLPTPRIYYAVWVRARYGNTAQPLGLMVEITYLLWPLMAVKTK